MFTEVEAMTHLKLQSQLNDRADQSWLAGRNPYLRSALSDCLDALDAHMERPEWWGESRIDSSLLTLENLWHYVISAIILNNKGNLKSASSELVLPDLGDPIHFDGKEFFIGKMDLLGKLELQCSLMMANRYSIALFQGILADCGMTSDDLYARYVSTNVMRFFRLDLANTAPGKYQYMWGGKPDEDHLKEIVSKLDVKDPNFSSVLYQGLARRYSELMS